jgi:hypothetical protein
MWIVGPRNIERIIDIGIEAENEIYELICLIHVADFIVHTAPRNYYNVSSH